MRQTLCFSKDETSSNVDVFVTFSETTDVPGSLLMTRHEIIFTPKLIANLKVKRLTQYTALRKGGKKIGVAKRRRQPRCIQVLDACCRRSHSFFFSE